MKKIQSYFVMLLLMLTAVSAQAYKLTVVSTVGRSLSINIYNHHSDGSWDFYNNLTNNTADYSVSCELAAGDSVKIEVMGLANLGWVYTHMECEGKKMFEGREVMVSSDVWPVFTMSSHDVTINACAEFDPEVPEGGWEYGDGQMQNPESPGTNSWNATTGELFVNYFQKAGQAPGGNSIGGFHLYTYLNQFGIKPADVKTLTVSGEVGRSSECFSSLGSYNALPNAEKLDLRHTFGHTSYQGVWDDGVNKHDDVLEIHVDGMPKLKQLILPSNIKYIGWWQLPPNSVLEAVTLYAAVPPAICISEYEYAGYMLYGFNRIPQSCVLYVPEQSVAAYKADKVWGTRFADVLAIPEGEAEDITVDLPDNFTDGRYVGMSLSLFNTQTGEETKYIVDERPSYIFYAQTCGEPYTAHLRNAQGVLMAATDTVTLGNKPIEMTFKHVKQLYDLSLQVQTPAEQEDGTPADVTDQTTIVWTDAMGNRLGTGPHLGSQIEGTRLLYTVTLPSELAAHYGVPPRKELVVTVATARTTVMLAQPDTIILSGMVTDTAGQPIAMATVTASLMMNGTVGKVFTATTDMLGRYELAALTGDLTLSASATGYVAARTAVSVVGGSPTDIAPVQLAPLSGPTIAYGFTYTESAANDEQATTLPGYSDYANVAIAAYNETTSRSLDSIVVQYPEVQLLSGAKAGDRVRLTATSLKDAFMPVEATLTLTANDNDSVIFALKELGGIEVSFQRSDNQEVIAALYDADGLLCRQEAFAEATLTFAGLKDGNYTIVTMGSDPLLSKMLYLSDYAAVGMEAGKDYVSNKVTVESGIITELTIDRIPTLYAEPFYYTDGTKTLFMSNKAEVSTSCNVTMRAEIGFKESIRDRVSNVRLLVNYPADKAEYVEGSSMTGTKMVRATVEDGRLTIPVENDYLDEPTRFILTAIDQGTLTAAAQVQFDIDGRTVTQPIGFATCDVKYMTIVAPETVSKLSFPVRGNAPANSPIRLYAGDDVLVGQTQAFADGSWQLHVDLPDCANLATIPLYAVVTTKQGREVKTETVNVTYDKDMIRPLHVLMYPRLPKFHDIRDMIYNAETPFIDFDFDHPEKIDDQWYVTSVDPSGPPYLFEIIFNTTDSSKVHNVVLMYETLRGDIDYLNAEYDGNTGHWMCSVKVGADAVVNVDVDFLDMRALKMDRLQYDRAALMPEFVSESVKNGAQEMEEKLAAIMAISNANEREHAIDEFFSNLGVEQRDIAMTAKDVQAWMNRADSLMQDVNLTDLLGSWDIYGENNYAPDGVTWRHATGLTPEQLEAEGYMKIEMTEGSPLYLLVEEDYMITVDFDNDKVEEIRFNSNEARTIAYIIKNQHRISGEEMLKKLSELVETVGAWAGDLNSAFSMLSTKLVQGVVNTFILPRRQALEIELSIAKTMLKCADKGEVVKATAKVAKLSTEMLVSKALELCFTKISVGPNGKVIVESFKDLSSTKIGKIAQKMEPAVKQLEGVIEKASWLGVVTNVVDCIAHLVHLGQVYVDIPDPCSEDAFKAKQLKNDILIYGLWAIIYYTGVQAVDVAVAADEASVPATLPAGIASGIAAIGVEVVKMIGQYHFDKDYERRLKEYRSRLDQLACQGDYEMYKKRIRAQYLMEKRHRANRNVRAVIDPSGYVYEAVADNRVENATATIYFKQTGEDEYGDLHDEVVKWRAEEFRQENPLLTDAQGKYAWDVPQGLWQVKIEKAGYETAYSDWLPVPPPQLDINIPLVRNTLPLVQAARAYEDGVEVTFSEYMRPQSLTAERLTLVQDGRLLPCLIEQQNLSLSYDKKDAYVSRVKVRTDSPLASGSKVQLTVRRQVEAYNGLQMQKDYQQEFTVVREVYAIGTDSIVEVARGGERTIIVHAFPAQAAAGMKLTAKSMISTIATVTDEAVFDANGEARLTVTGKVGGQTALLLTLENAKVKAQSVIQVDDPSTLPVYAPTASHISGTFVAKGEAVTLHTDTEGATIWYTTDGSCPCDENGSRKQYTAPLPVNGAVTIRAYAVKDGEASRVVTFTYGVYDPVAVESAELQPAAADSYYSTGGVKQNRLRKGVNIVKRTDGSTVKVLR